MFIYIYADCCKTGKIDKNNTNDRQNFACLFGCDIMNIL